MKQLFISLVLFFALLQLVQAQPVPQNEFDTVWTRYTQYVKQIAFHPNSQLLASGGLDAYVSIWDVTTGTELRKIGGASCDRAVKFSIPGNLLAFGGGGDLGGVKIVNCSDWSEVRKIVTPTNNLSISPDESKIAICGKNSITIWDISTGQQIHGIDTIGKPDPKGYISSLFNMEYTPDGRYIIFTDSDGKLRFLNTETYIIDFEYNYGYGYLSISNDGSLIAYIAKADSQAVQIMNTTTKDIVRVIPVPPNTGSGLAFSPDKKYLAVAYEFAKILKIYDINTGENKYNYLEKPATWFDGISWSSDGLFIAGGAGQLLYLYSTLWNSIPDDTSKEINVIYPNPSDNTINIKFILPKPCLIQINLIGEVGNKIKVFYYGFLEQGEKNIKGSISDIPSGSYTVQVLSNDFIKNFKLIINK